MKIDVLTLIVALHGSRISLWIKDFFMDSVNKEPGEPSK